MTDDTTTSRPLDFIRERVRADVAAGKHGGKVVTRFPPEPNGYLHIGHAKAICLDFGVAEEYGGHCNLRFDDTNPTAEDTEYVEAIERDVRWLGFDWGDKALYASDYFDQLYDWALELIRKGKAYVCSLSPEEARAYRGRWNEPGRNSPYRERSVEENLDLFERMKNGEFANGVHTLRAKIDMSSSNMNLRDPVLYRILHAEHHRTGATWCIYPMYDWAHGQSDAIEGVTHSLCTLEFEDHRPLYDWFLDHIEGIHQPVQIEFARLNLTYTLTSKRKLRRLIDEALVDGWDDPRMPTLTALRRRGCPPEAIRDLCARVGLTKNDSVVDLSQLEFAIRNELNRTAPRVMGVLRPLKVVIENYPDDLVEELDAINNPEDASAGTRKVPFSRVLYIEQDDFRRDPPRKFFRLAPGREVRLRYAYFITCTEAIEDEDGNVVELRCTYDPATRGGDAPDGRKVKATLHWVSAAHAIEAEVRLYDRLFNHPNPAGAPGEIEDHLNPESLEVLKDCKLEPSLAGAEVGDRVQFERLGYFCVDPDSAAGAPVFNRTVTLRDTWAKIERAQKARERG